MKVQVLMSSYNGEHFIEDQLDSILSQKNVEVSILVRDDGSTDNTPSILERKANKDSRVKVSLEKNIGVKNSFLKLIKMSEAGFDYYAFSDQDDIWLPDKLCEAIDTLSYQDNDIPLIYGSPVYLYVEGDVVGEQFMCPSPKLGNFLVKNYYPGCTMVFNRALCELVKKVDYTELNSFPLHDHWLNLVCTACGGKVIIDSKPYILYRQHNNNVIGDRDLIQRIKGNGLFTTSNHTRYKICEELNKFYRELFSKDALNTVDTVLKYRDGTGCKMKLAMSKEVKPFSVIEKISLTLMVLLEKY